MENRMEILKKSREILEITKQIYEYVDEYEQLANSRWDRPKNWKSEIIKMVMKDIITDIPSHLDLEDKEIQSAIEFIQNKEVIPRIKYL